MNWIMIVLFHPEGKVWVDFSIHTNSCGKKQQPFSPYFSSVMCTAHLSPPTHKKTCFSHKLFYLYTVLQVNFFMSRLISLLWQKADPNIKFVTVGLLL